MRFTRAALTVAIGFLSAAAFAMGSIEQPVTGLAGNVLAHPSPAADFTLTDQNGAVFHMMDTRGKVVVMAFIYTHCTDVCPFEAVKVKDAAAQLGDVADRVVFVAVTTDPRRDTAPVRAAYSKSLGLLSSWHFLGGPATAIHKVWDNYGIGVVVDPATDAVAADAHAPSASDRGLLKGLSSSDLGLVGEIVQQFGSGYDVGHSAPFWIVDKRGIVQVELGGDATPADLVKDVRILLAHN